MTIDVNKAVAYRNCFGNQFPARIITADRKSEWPIVALVTNERGKEIVYSCNTSGQEYASNGCLVNIPTRTSYFRPTYADLSIGDRYLSKERFEKIVRNSKATGFVEFIYEDDVLVETEYHKREVSDVS